MVRSPFRSVLAALVLAVTLVAPQAFAQTSGSASGADSSSVSGSASTVSPTVTTLTPSNAVSTSGAASGSASGSSASPAVVTNTPSVSGADSAAGASNGSASASKGGDSAASTGPSTSAATNDASNAGNAQAVNYNSYAPASETLRTAVAIAAPALVTNSNETCMGSTSGAISVVGWGVTGGTTHRDPACVRRLDARELAETLGDRDAAKEVICNDPAVFRAYNVLGRPCRMTPKGQPNPLFAHLEVETAPSDQALTALSAATPADAQSGPAAIPPPATAPPAPASTSSAPSTPAASPPPSTAPPAAEPEFWRMAPIPNPEDMPTAERHQIYGHRYDYLDRGQAAPVASAHHHGRHHHGRRHYRARHEHTATAARVHARYGAGFKAETPQAAAEAARRVHPAAKAMAKPATIARARPAKTASPAHAKVAVAASRPAVSSAPAATPAPIAAASPSTSSQTSGRILAAAIALLLGAAVIAMALRQSMSGARRRKPPVRNYPAPTPPAETETDEKKAG